MYYWVLLGFYWFCFRPLALERLRVQQQTLVESDVSASRNKFPNQRKSTLLIMTRLSLSIGLLIFLFAFFSI